MFLVVFSGFFRVSELTTKGANFKPLLQMQDLHYHFKQNFVASTAIVIKDIKHNANRRPFLAVLELTEGTELCPVSCLYRYSAVRGSLPGPLFFVLLTDLQ